MWVFFVAAGSCLLVAMVLVLLVMPMNGVDWLVRIDVGVAWVAALSTLLLVPADVSHTLQGEHPTALRVGWQVSYWYGFIAMFTFLPIHQEYSNSGHFKFRDRMWSAVKSNLYFYLVVTVLGTAGLLFLLFTGRLAFQNVVGFCIALSNAFGLIAGIFLMGYGLVAIPKHLWKAGNVKLHQQLLCRQAGIQANLTLKAHRRLSTSLGVADSTGQQFRRNDPLRKYVDQILVTADDARKECPANPEDGSGDNTDYFDILDLGNLRRQLRTSLEDFRRERALYINVVKSHLETEDVAKNLPKPGHAFESSTHRPIPTWLAHLEWWWRCYLQSWAYRGLAVFTAALSAAIVLAEATIPPSIPNLSLFSLLLHRISADSDKGDEVPTQLTTFALLAYPCMAAYYALYRLGRFSFYRLIPGHTNAYSLLANALLMCRFAAPLAFNFMAAIAIPVSKYADYADVEDTVFYEQFGKIMMEQPVIGTSFTTFAPLLIIPYTALLVFNVFNRVASFFTWGDSSGEADDDWEARDARTAEGMRLLKLEAQAHKDGQEPGSALLSVTGGPEEGLDEALLPQPSKGGGGKGRRSWWSFSGSTEQDVLVRLLDSDGRPARDRHSNQDAQR
ncbi:hypothetical protein WJX74_004847 [Apatococcus lobatus]|uniref:LMBR1-like membrane protein n=1 Tax=Apatococcus lobatus TaxID=904363 RepID=A0AAW1QGY7_9CHLO